MVRPGIRRSLIDHSAKDNAHDIMISGKEMVLRIGDSVCLRAVKVNASSPIFVLEREY